MIFLGAIVAGLIAWAAFTAAVVAVFAAWDRHMARTMAAHRAQVIAADRAASRVLPPGTSLSDAYRVAAERGCSLEAAAIALHDTEVRARMAARLSPHPFHRRRRGQT